MNTTQSFLGTGWAFPPAFDRRSGSVAMVSDREDIEQSLTILLSTSIGERVMQPLYGCNLRDFLFEPANVSYLGLIKDTVERAILFFEPRILVQQVSITEADDPQLYEGKISIEVEYIIAGTNTRNNFVFPFYLLEADRRNQA